MGEEFVQMTPVTGETIHYGGLEVKFNLKQQPVAQTITCS